MKKVKDVSKLSGLSKRTLQYYDEKGILNVKRSEGNYRLYEEEDLQKLWEIVVYKELGFSLEEIRELINTDEFRKNEIMSGYLKKIKSMIRELEQNYKFVESILLLGIPAPNEGKGTFQEKAKKIKELELYGSRI